MKLTQITPSGGASYETPRLRPALADFSAGWEPYGVWSHSLTLYREGSRVHLQGFLKCTTPEREILKLPVGLRSAAPATLTLMRLPGEATVSRVDVSSTLTLIRTIGLVAGSEYYIQGSWRTDDAPPVVLPFMQG